MPYSVWQWRPASPAIHSPSTQIHYDLMLEMYVELPCNLQKTDLLTEAFNVQFTGQKARPADLQTIKKQSTERYKIGLTQNDAWLNQSVDAQFLGADRSRFL